MNLLKERFHFEYRLEKDFDAYDLVIAKGGPKLKAAAPGRRPPGAGSGARHSCARSVLDQDPDSPSCPPAAPPRKGEQRRRHSPDVSIRLSGAVDWHARAPGGTNIGQDRLDRPLRFQAGVLRGPVEHGRRHRCPGAGCVRRAGKQLGLKLEKTTVLLDLLVIEQLQRKVTEN